MYKYVNSNQVWTASYYNQGLGSWIPNFALHPGEGAFLETPVSFTATFTGTPHVPVLPVNIPNGTCYLLSRQTNATSGNLFYQLIVGTIPTINSKVLRWSGGGHDIYSYDPDAFGWQPAPAEVRVGESLWICPAGGTVAAFPTNFFGPVLRAMRSGSDVRIEWQGGGVLLQSSNFSHWTELPGATSPHTASAEGTNKFYRVRR